MLLQDKLRRTFTSPVNLTMLPVLVTLALLVFFRFYVNVILDSSCSLLCVYVCVCVCVYFHSLISTHGLHSFDFRSNFGSIYNSFHKTGRYFIGSKSVITTLFSKDTGSAACWRKCLIKKNIDDILSLLILISTATNQFSTNLHLSNIGMSRKHLRI